MTLLVCSGLLGGAGAAFWYQDWQYSLPTPRPSGLRQPAIGTIPRQLAALTLAQHGHPLFLHFYNPGCPCSRFNLDQIRALTAKYGSRVQFVAVVQGDSPWNKPMDPHSLGLPMKTVIDQGGAIAHACGVYSTPQGVLLDVKGQLYYRGNYNSSRYCTESATQYARIALDSLLAGNPPPKLPASATVSYGCPLPSNIKGNPAL